MSGRRARKRTYSGNIIVESPKEKLPDILPGLLSDNNFLEYLQNEKLLSPFECFFINHSPDKTNELFKILLEKQIINGLGTIVHCKYMPKSMSSSIGSTVGDKNTGGSSCWGST